MPPKHICDAFLNAFTTFIYPIVPLIDLPSFQSWYSVFWKWCNRSFPSDNIPPALLEDVTVLSLLFALLYAGASVAPESSWSSQPLKDLTKGFILRGRKEDYKTILLACAHQSHPTLSTITAELLVDPFTRNLDSLANGLFISSIARLAQSVGLHRDDDCSSSPSQSTKHLRQRVWSHIIWLDVQYSVVKGLPPGIACPGNRPARLPNPIPVIKLGVDHASFARDVLLHDRDERAHLAHMFLSHIHGMGDLSESKYRELVAQAKDSYRVSSSAADDIPLHREHATAFTRWAGHLVILTQLELLIFIHGPLLRLPGPSEGTQGKSQNESVWTRLTRLCIRYLRIYISATSKPESQSYAWFFSRTAGPVYCFYLLLMCLRYCPASNTAGIARMCVRDVFVHWESSQEHGVGGLMGYTASREKLKVFWEGFPAHGQEVTSGDPVAFAEPVERSAGNLTEKQNFELDLDFIDEVFDWSGWWLSFR
ncbi:hypothetical protein BDV06DRAFT_184099 [Aspergillus oleicola]